MLYQDCTVPYSMYVYDIQDCVLIKAVHIINFDNVYIILVKWYTSLPDPVVQLLYTAIT